MRKLDWFAWAFLLSLGGLIAVKFHWFREQYVVGGHWAVEGWHWALEHVAIVRAVVIAFVLGLAIGWGRMLRLVDRAIKGMARLVAEHKQLGERYDGLMVRYRQLEGINGQLTRQVEALREDSPVERLPRRIPNEEEVRLESPKPKRPSKKKAQPRPWQERLLDDDGLDEPAQKTSIEKSP